MIDKMDSSDNNEAAAKHNNDATNDKNNDNKQQEDPVVSFVNGQVEAVQKVMKLIELSEAQKLRQGFSELNFAVGVLNCFLLIFVFGRYPQHFWLLYLLESLILLPTRFYQMTTSNPNYNEAFYYMDYCWIMNITACLLLSSLFIFDMSASYRQVLFQVYAGAAMGPLLGSTIILPFIALVFHNLMSMTAFCIHVLPPAVVYTIFQHSNEIQQAYPNYFKFHYIHELSFKSIAMSSMALYWIWFFTYVVWMYLWGWNMPSTKPKKSNNKHRPYDTVFHVTMRGGVCVYLGSKIWKRPKRLSEQQAKTNQFEVRDFIVYMMLHALLTHFAIFVLGYLCFTYPNFHAFILVVLIVLCTQRGAKQYTTYYSSKRTASKIVKEFQHLLDHDGILFSDDDVSDNKKND